MLISYLVRDIWNAKLPFVPNNVVVKYTLENTEWAIKNWQSRETGNMVHTRLFGSSLPPVVCRKAYVCSLKVVSKTYCIVFLRLVCTMLPVSLDCQFLIAHSVFSNVYLTTTDWKILNINALGTILYNYNSINLWHNVNKEGWKLIIINKYVSWIMFTKKIALRKTNHGSSWGFDLRTWNYKSIYDIMFDIMITMTC
jgi:hypothetical protein